MSTKTSFDPSVYPKTYRAPLKKGIGKIFSISLLFILILFARAHLGIYAHPAWFYIFVFSLWIILVLVFINRIFTRIILYADRIECISPLGFGKEVLNRGKIRGCSQISNMYGIKASVLLYEDDTRSSLYKIKGYMPFMIPDGIEKDDAWNTWMDVAPNLDNKE